MNQYLDGMLEFAEWMVDSGIVESGPIMAMACFCYEKFDGTPYNEYVDVYLNGRTWD